MSKPIKAAIIGCGRISGHHCRSLKQIPGADLVAVCDLVAEKGDIYAKEFNRPSYTNYHEMFQKHPEINVVAIATPSGMHFEHAMEIMTSYKKNLIVEKPTFMKPSQLEQAFDTAEKLNLAIFPVFQNRHNLAVKRVQQGINNGELGKVRLVSVRVRWCRPQRYYDLAPWRGTFAMDGGALTNQGVHHVDLIRKLGGEVKRVSSTMRTLGANIEVEDAATALLELENGAVGTIEVTTAARPLDFEASISFVCENGLAQIGGIAVNELQTYTPEPEACKTNSEDFSGNIYGHGHQVLYKEIADYFIEGKPFSVTREDCYKTINLLHTIYRADEMKSWVDVNKEESNRLGRPDETLANIYRSQRPL
jgi:UDP-N-acetyl-2-amino-2-deoxyglucuronate dehydrogenase